METMLYFRKTAEDAVCVPASWLNCIDADNDFVMLYFDNGISSEAAVNKVKLDCANDKSAILVKNISTAIANASVGRKGRVVVIADDIDGVYVAEATAVNTITVDYATS
tara:strand:- start:188 stop:514 length:327 start_codon:yes stop_codon:yes gene_type:complete